jgi:hypothetical protein
MKKWEATDQIFVYLTLSVISAATHCSYVLLDCHARIKIKSKFIYEFLEKCTSISFSKQSVLGKWPTWRTVLYYVFIFIFNSLHVSSTSCSSLGETNCVNTTSGNCHPLTVVVSCSGRKWTSDISLPTCTRPPTQIDSFHRLCWHNLLLLIMSTMSSKYVES